MRVSSDSGLVVVAGSSVVRASDERPVAKPVDRVSLGEAGVVGGSVEVVRARRPERRADVARSVEADSYRPSPRQVARRVVEEAELSARLRAMIR